MSHVKMDAGMRGQVINYKYWQTLRSVETDQKESRPSREAIEFEKHLQSLEKENKLYEMGLAMKQASLQKNKALVCSLDALRQNEKNTKSKKATDTKWYLTKDQIVDDEDDYKNDELLAIVERKPEYCPIVQKIKPKQTD